MTNTVLLATNVQPAFRAALADRYEVLGPLSPPFEPAASALSAADASRVRAIVTMGSLVIPEPSLDRFPALGLLARRPIDRMLAFTAALKSGKPVAGLVPNIGAA